LSWFDPLRNNFTTIFRILFKYIGLIEESTETGDFNEEADIVECLWCLNIVLSKDLCNNRRLRRARPQEALPLILTAA
jgi:hypothetical protein